MHFVEVDPSVLGPKYKKSKKKTQTTDFKSDVEVTKEATRNVIEEFNNRLASGETVSRDEVLDALNEPADHNAPIEFEKESELVEVEPIKSCPFCKGSAKLITDMSFGNERYFAQIKCKDCGAIGPRSFDTAHDGMFVFDAISKWNRRG